MLSDISTDPYLPGSNKYTKALIYLCLTNTANTLGCQFACAYQIPRLDFRWTAKQSVFLRIQVRASSQTKGLE